MTFLFPSADVDAMFSGYVILKGTLDADHFLLACVCIATYDFCTGLQASDGPFFPTVWMVGTEDLTLSCEG